jgi:tetratricopeptide (TPR) repeat protein
MSASPFSVVDILDQAHAGRLVLQDFRPLSESLEWELGQDFYRQRGNQAFIGDEPVPYVIHNDGNHSIRAAELFFTSLVAAEEKGSLEQDIFVLEVGIGVGLFARYFLDWFRHLCDQAGKEYYDRLCYVLVDRSARMLRDAGRHGVFQNHPGRYRLRLGDAQHPERLLTDEYDIGRLGPRPFRAVFLNYVLDCLPAMVIKVEGEQVLQLHVRTGIASESDWRSQLLVSPDELRQMAASPDPGQRRDLLAVYPLFISEYQYQPVDRKLIPFTDFVLEQAQLVQGRPLLHNHGALACLESLLRLLSEEGFILVSDYGETKDTVAEEFEHQHFSQSTAVGLNFPLLAKYFCCDNRACWREASGEEASLHIRLLMHKVQPQIAIRFEECFCQEARQRVETPASKARELTRIGRFQAALTQYREALARQPFSWVLMSEVAHFLTFTLGNAKAGLEMARAALRHNPGCSAELWNILGDCLYYLGRMRDARVAYEHALAINTNDVRANYNLAFVHIEAKEYHQALVRLSEGLALDHTGGFRERLLEKQREVLNLLALQNQRRCLGQANRVASISRGSTRGSSIDAQGSLPGGGDAEQGVGRKTHLR